MRERPSAARAAGREHGPEQAQTGGAGDEDAGELEQPVGRDERQEEPEQAVVGHDGARLAQGDGVGVEHVGGQEAGDAAGHAHGGDAGVIGPHHGGEVGGPVGGVVGLELLVGVAAQLAGAAQGGHRLRAAQGPHPDDHGDGQFDDGHAEGPPAQAVQRGRHALQHVAAHVVRGHLAGARHAAAGGGDAGRHQCDQLRLGGAGADARQVPGRRPVQADELIDLGAGEPAAGDQMVQPLPLIPVGGGEGIDIHGRSVS